MPDSFTSRAMDATIGVATLSGRFFDSGTSTIRDVVPKELQLTVKHRSHVMPILGK